MKRFTIHTGSKFIGIVLLIISVVLLITLLSLIKEFQKVGVSQCSCPSGACPMENQLPIQTYISFILVLVLSGIGIFTLIPKQIEGGVKKEEWESIMRTLKDDEKKIYQAVLDSGGLILQGDLVEKTKISKVKVSRILDKLEIKDLVERRRRGMSNLVVLRG